MVSSTVKRGSGSLLKRSRTAERPNARQTGQLQPFPVDYAKEAVIPTWDYIATTACASRCNDEMQKH